VAAFLALDECHEELGRVELDGSFITSFPGVERELGGATTIVVRTQLASLDSGRWIEVS
jgi:hypothetical protein